MTPSTPSMQRTPPPPTRPLLGLLLALGAVVLWGSNAVIARHLALEGVSMTALAFLRVAIGGIALGLWVAVTAPATLRTGGALLRDRWVWLALLCYSGNMLVFHWALARTSASAVMMLENIAPVIALFGGAWLFRERITWRALVALGLALGGVGLVCAADPGLGAAARAGAQWGNALAVVAGITWGGYTLACRGHGRRDVGHEDGLAAMVVMLLGSAVLLGPSLYGVTGWPATPVAWGWVVTLGVLHTALANALWRLALAQIPAYTASLLFLLTIVLTMGNAWLFLHERVTPLMLLGAGGIVAALLTMIEPSRRGAKDQS
jgi:drug/metabolite transporter (DMT)-like permease